MSRATGTATSLALTGVGAILAFATSLSAMGFDGRTLGWVLMQIGAAGLLVAFMIGDVDRDSPHLFVDRERHDAPSRVIDAPQVHVPSRSAR
ncbi:MAG: hypothetical protein ABIQ73_09675 [Acidimicrobiales bacterium]